MTEQDCKMLDKLEDRGSYDHVAFNIKHAKNFQIYKLEQKRFSASVMSKQHDFNLD